MINGPSKHLTWKELACKDGTAYPQEWRTTRGVQLGELFEFIREQWGKPIQILSAYRTPMWNKKIGGARYSQHMEGRAMDLKPPDGVSLPEFYDAIVALSGVTGIRGIGKYKTFVHVDVRPKDKIVFWSGDGVKDSSISA